MDYIPYGRQSISENDISEVVKVLKSDWLTTGPCIEKFEQKLAEYCQAKHTFAVCNATAALHLAYLALGVGEGDYVWTSPNTFVATSNAALMCRAKVDFVDICPQTYNLSVSLLEAKLIEAQKKGCLPKVVTPVHFAGQSCDMKTIHELSRQYNFKIVEDASHAIGGKYLNQPVGSCKYSDITVFSFHPVKIVTTGEGGALLTNSKALADRISLLRTHGITKDPAFMDKPTEGDWYHQMLDLGYNYRITDIQCALGISQMDRLDKFVEKRHQIKKRYEELLNDVEEITIPFQDKDNYSALHLYPIQVAPHKRRKIFDYLRGKEIGVNVHYIPVYLQPYYKKLGFKEGLCPNAERYYNSVISLPVYSDLTGSQIAFIVACLKEGMVL